MTSEIRKIESDIHRLDVAVGNMAQRSISQDKIIRDLATKLLTLEKHVERLTAKLSTEPAQTQQSLRECLLLMI